MTNYYQQKALSQSAIKTYLTDGAYRFWKHSVFNDQRVADKDSDAKRIGRLVDCLLFTPAQLELEWAIKQKVDGRTTAGKAYNLEFELTLNGRGLANEEEQADAQHMVDMLKANPTFQELTQGQWVTQKELFWEADGLPCKAKLDLIANGIVFDYKTCQNCDESHFGKDMVNYKYHIQDAYYKEAFKKQYGFEPRVIFIAQEKDFPDCLAFWELQPADIAIARREIARARKEIKARLDANNWTPSNSGVQSINLPTWFYSRQQEDDARVA